MEYQLRIIDEELDALMEELPALALEGPRGVGKTATATRRAHTVFELDDPGQREVLAADPSLINAADGTVLIDEWQRLASTWDVVRRLVDAGARAGRFLLTGSAVARDEPVHSGAGRIARLRMRPLSLAERALAEPTVGLGAMLTGSRPDVAGTSDLTVQDYVEEILASGFPGIRPRGERARRVQIDSYIAGVVEHDFAEQGLRVRRPGTLRAWLAAYAAATSSTTSYNALLDAATAGEVTKPARTTTTAYRDVLARLWLVDPVPGWVPNRNHLRRLTQAPKHHLADPALAAHLLGVDARALLRGQSGGPDVPRDGTLLGALFESLVTLSVRVYAQANGASVHHLRTRDSDHEVDLIVQRRDQKVVALEVKLGGTLDRADLRHLVWLGEQLGEDLLDAAVITAGPHAYRRPDGIAVVPAALLGV
ncbi:MAG: ATP-binding protein [Acidimicrobiales bacterium]